DEVAVFDKALTVAQIAAQYAAAFTDVAFTFRNCQKPPGTTLFSGTSTTADAVPGSPSNQRGYIGDDGTGTNCVLHLTDPINDSYGVWLIPDQASGNNVDHLKVNWRSLIGGGSAADGYSFSWATDLPAAPSYGNPGEEGAGTGLVVAVDTFENGSTLDPWGDGGNNGGPEAGIEIHWQGAIVAYQFVNQNSIRKNQFVNVEVEVETSGLARFNYDGNIITAQLSGWHGIAGGSFMFGARTGGANDNQWIDDVLITVFPPTAPFITQQPADLTLRQGLNATFNVTVIGSEPLNYQWLRKLTTDAAFVPIAGANAASYTTPPLVPDDDNSLFKVQVNNALGMVESRAALLHVLSDTNPPTILSSAGSGDFMHATILFSEELEMGTAIDTFNYTISGGLAVNAAVLSADRRSVTLTTDVQAADTLYTITVNNVADLANLAIAMDSMTTYRTWTTGPCNGVLFEAYDTLPVLPGQNRVAVSELTGHANFPNNPRDVALITTLDSRLAYPDDSHEDYGGRMRGVFFPRESGLHTFYLAADDNAELWLSTDLSPANKVRIARETMWSNTKEWTMSAGSSDVAAKKSAPIHLVGGQPYYIEALYKEGGGGDHCAVAVQTPIDASPPMNGSGEIPAFMMGSPNAPAGFAGAITFPTPVADQTAVQCRSATFISTAANPNNLPMCHQWQLNGVDIPGANHPSYTTPPTQLSDEGARYTVNVTMFGGASASASARLHVTPDRTPPDCPTAADVSQLNQVVLTFNEVLDQTSAENTANYSIAGVTTVSAVLNASKTVVTLTVNPLLPTGASLSVAVHGVADCSGNAVSPCSPTFRTWQLRYGSARREFYLNIGSGTAVPDLTGNGKYPNSPDMVNFTEFLESPVELQMDDGADRFNNYGTRVSGLLLPPVSGNYNFFIASDDNSEFWLSTDDNPANKVLICREPAWATIRNWTDPANGRRNAATPENQSTTLFPAGIPLTAGLSYYFEALMKEGGGGDNVAVTWQTPAGGPQPGVPVNANIADANGDPGGTKPIPGRYMATLVPPGSDTTPPTIVSCKQLYPRNILVVSFSEIMRGQEAENLANYSVPGATLTSASLRPDERGVVLTAAADIPTGGTLTVNNLKDGVGNSIAANTIVPIVTVNPFLTNGGPQNIIAIEAEHFADVEAQSGLEPWSLQNSLPGYSGDGWAEITIPTVAPGNFRRFHENLPNMFIGFGAQANYLVNFPVGGTYYIWVRGSTPGGGNNSFHIGLDGVSPGESVRRVGNGVNNWGGNATAFGWHNNANSSPARLDGVTPGVHTINFWPREDGTRVDKILFTTDAAFTIGAGNGVASPDLGPPEVQNDCPVATASSVSVMQDASVAFQLQASDADGDALQYSVTQPPAHGVVVVAVATGAATYTPNAGYCGPDRLKFRVTDGQCQSQEATVTIDVVCLNRCPTARITTIALCTELETNTFISPNGSNACFVLDGSLSSDPDGDTLTYAWFADGSVVPFAAGVRVTNCFDLGEHTITLVVDDGRCTRSTSVTVDVLTGGEAVEALIAKVNDASLSRANKRPLIATLKASIASFERGSFQSAAGQLGAFINKVQAQIAPGNPDEAALFIRSAQSIIDSLNCKEAGGIAGGGC
ncbi:MAG TPA: PA14 domain-containing protein, partial [Verrucomicrobiae bacterium]|nr:PA14 domain-containing protein [Verrucomicrobiae bacterium]